MQDVLAEPTPCDDCRHAARCAEGLACSAFGLYAKGASPARWQVAPRTDATAERYARLFAATAEGGAA
jgi:hypothetical protein